MPETTRGMFFNCSLELISRHLGKQATKELCTTLSISMSYNPLFKYPIQDLALLEETAAPRIFADRQQDAAMHAFGAGAFDTFADSMAGRIGLALTAKDLWKLSERIPGFYSFCNQFGNVSSTRLGERSFALEYSGYRNCGEYHHGLLEHGLAKLGHQVQIHLEIKTLKKNGPGDLLTDFAIRVSW